MVRDAGHDDIADALARRACRNPLPGMWSFQMVEAFDDGFYAEAKGVQQRAIDELMDGRRHVFQAEMKELRRTRGARATRRRWTTPTATPSTTAEGGEELARAAQLREHVGPVRLEHSACSSVPCSPRTPRRSRRRRTA